jgi:hypothetical protein
MPANAAGRTRIKNPAPIARGRRVLFPKKCGALCLRRMDRQSILMIVRAR